MDGVTATDSGNNAFGTTRRQMRSAALGDTANGLERPTSFLSWTPHCQLLDKALEVGLLCAALKKLPDRSAGWPCQALQRLPF